MSSHSYSYRTPPNQSGAFAKMAAVLLGLLVAVVGFFALLMWVDARDRDSGTAEAAPAAAKADDHATDHNTALPLNSFAGMTGPNAQELAAAHKPYNAAMPPIPAGDVVKVRMVMKHKTVEIAPGSSTTSGRSTGSPPRRARSSTSVRARRSSSRS